MKMQLKCSIPNNGTGAIEMSQAFQLMTKIKTINLLILLLK